jgi:hypothetical protein
MDSGIAKDFDIDNFIAAAKKNSTKAASEKEEVGGSVGWSRGIIILVSGLQISRAAEDCKSLNAVAAHRCVIMMRWTAPSRRHQSAIGVR